LPKDAEFDAVLGQNLAEEIRPERAFHVVKAEGPYRLP
jgi:hypothetical protein